MKRPTPPPAELTELIAVCLELYECRGAGAVDAVLREHPDSADHVRERLDLLGRMGLIGEAPEESRPERIGDYRIEGVLGRGGMGVVYEAEQAHPRRRVALKVLRSWPGEQALGRFRHEAELLARLQHPGIAAVHEAGTAVVGGVTVPFFAMELVRGRPLDAYADEEGLDTRARVSLVAKVADAVHHAHQKGVVHRDLKPANVIVDERGEPRVLDFGVARAIDPDLRLGTLRTEVGQLVGTLAYMSPEQAAGDPDQIDSRTDIYALGAVAFELFSGRLPREVDGRPVLEVLQAIRDEEPPRLGELDRSLRGDLETIVATALSRERERRYPSADALAADLRRFMRDEPITARPATAAYQLAKLARRHRALVGASAAVLVALVLGLAGTLVGFLRAAEQRDDAERRFRLANVASSFHTRMFATADPSGAGIRVEDLLRRAATMVGPPGEDPLETAVVQLALGEAFAGIGAYEEAETFLAQALETFERELGPADVQSLWGRTRLVDLLARAGRVAEAEAALDGLVETAASAHGARHKATLRARIVHASLANVQGRFLMEVQREVLGPEHPDTLASIVQVFPLYQVRRQFERAEELVREALEIATRVLTQGHPTTRIARAHLAMVLIDLDRPAEAEELLRENLALESEQGPDHYDTVSTKNSLAIAVQEQGRLDEAEELFLEVLAATRRMLGDRHAHTVLTVYNVGDFYRQRRRCEEADVYLREAAEMLPEVLEADDYRIPWVMSTHALNLGHLGRLDEAEVVLARAESFCEPLEGEHPAWVKVRAIRADLDEMDPTTGGLPR